MHRAVIVAAIVASVSTPARGVVFGKDDRAVVDTYDAATRRIVRIATFAPGGTKPDLCTGALVGRDLVLTASHCLVKAVGKWGRDPKQTRFGILDGARIQIDLFGGKAGSKQAAGIDIVRGSRAHVSKSAILGRVLAPVPDNHADWAIVRIDEPFGDEVGFLDAIETIKPKLDDKRKGKPLPGNGPVLLPGFTVDDSGATMRVHRGCRLRAWIWFDRMFEHDCDMTAGTSGAPILRCTRSDCAIVAINQGGAGPARARAFNTVTRRVNVAIAGWVFANKVAAARKSWPPR